MLRRVAGKRDALCGDTKPLEGLVPPLLQPRLVGGVGFTGEPGRSSSGPVSANTCLSRRRTPRCAMRICLISVSVRAQIHGGFLRHLPRPKSTDASPDRGGSGPPRFSRDPRWHKRLETRQSRSACFGLSRPRSGPRRSGTVAMRRHTLLTASRHRKTSVPRVWTSIRLGRVGTTARDEPAPDPEHSFLEIRT